MGSFRPALPLLPSCLERLGGRSAMQKDIPASPASGAPHLLPGPASGLCPFSSGPPHRDRRENPQRRAWRPAAPPSLSLASQNNRQWLPLLSRVSRGLWQRKLVCPCPGRPRAVTCGPRGHSLEERPFSLATRAGIIIPCHLGKELWGSNPPRIGRLPGRPGSS